MTRGEVYRLKAERGARGHELRGARYAVVVQADELAALSTVVVAPTSASSASSWLRPEVRVEGTKTRVMVEHVKAVDLGRLGPVAGALSRAEMEEVDDALRLVLGLN